jgi:hypothetical protein
MQQHDQTTSQPVFIIANDSICYRALTSAIREKCCLLCDRIISRGLWPPRSPDLSFCDFYEYVWENLKRKVYKNNPHSIEAVQNEITCVIGSITVDQLQKVSHNLFTRCEACMQTEGGHCQHLL